jgi:hypothetical protein
MPSLSPTLRKGTSLPLESFYHWYPLKLQTLSRFFAMKSVLESPDLPQSSAQVICSLWNHSDASHIHVHVTPASFLEGARELQK